jgi:hypothetical protein
MLLVIAATLLLLSGCVTVPKPTRSYTDPNYSPGRLFNAKVIVYASNDVTVNEFKKSFNEAYLNGNNFSKVITDTLSSIFNLRFPESEVIKAETDSIGLLNLNDSLRYSYMQKYRDSSRDNYIIHVRKSTIDQRNQSNYNQFNKSATTTEYCTVNMLVDVYDLNGNKIVDSIIIEEEQASLLFGYKTCLKKAIDRAIKKVNNLITNIEAIR